MLTLLSHGSLAYILLFKLKGSKSEIYTEVLQFNSVTIILKLF